MRRLTWCPLALVFSLAALALAPAPTAPQTKKLIYWTHWEQNPEFNKFYETRGKDFAQKTGWEVQVVTVPYQGYEAKYLAALENLPKYMVGVGKWKGARYGIPIEHGNFQQMYINVDLMKKAGLDPDKPVKTLDDWLAAMKKLTVLDAKGETTQAGFALRHKGHPVGITDKFLPFAHAFGARMLSPNLEHATGFANSADMVAALQFYQDLVQKYKVASLAFPTPEDAFGQKRAATIFRESWFFGWVKKNAPDVTFKVVALPCGKACPGAGNLFPWTNLVYKNSPNKQAAWEFLRFISTAKDDLDQHQAQGILPVWTANLESAYVKARPDYQSTQDMLKQPVPPEYYHPKSNELATAFGEAVVAALYGKGQPKPLLDEAAAKMDRVLKD